MRPGVLTRQRLIRWIGALLVLSLGVSALIGWAGGSSGRFDWNLAAVAGTAFGTVALAGFTGALAWTTGGDVQATWELAEAQREDQRARDRPVVVASIARWTSNARRGDVLHGALHVELFNAGLGPALEILLQADHPDGRIHVQPRILPVLAPLERFPFALAIEIHGTDGNEGALFSNIEFRLSGSCQDRSRDNTYEIVQLDAAEPLPGGS